jgi:uncharacterized protein YacL
VDTILRLILLAVTTTSSYFIIKEIFMSNIAGLLGAVAGLGLGYLILKVEERLSNIPLKTMFGSLLGLTLSIILTNLFISRLLLALARDIPITLPIYILIYFVMAYIGF